MELRAEYFQHNAFLVQSRCAR
ncbi:hypothetical protein LINPERHAP1_LOCUS31652 [Linum perenne]